ncbi:MAG: macro domain-containing protein [Deltaproteobacteria bacterium]|nr:macro domain-containing protein [Deltaproteobacteria bacterium]
MLGLLSTDQVQSKYLLNVVSVGNPGTPQDEAFTILKSVLSALQTASEHRIDSVVIPALGTGIIGKLTPAQSAWTILHAVEQFRLAKPNTIPQKIIIAIYGDPQTYEVFSRILTLGTQDPTAMSMARGPGRTFDLIRWLAEAEAGDRVKLS